MQYSHSLVYPSAATHPAQLLTNQYVLCLLIVTIGGENDGLSDWVRGCLRIGKYWEGLAYLGSISLRTDWQP
jgi:hypothetical protein